MPPRKPNDHSWLNCQDPPLFVLNGLREILVFNLGCQQLTGWTDRDVVGTVCEYSSDADLESPESLARSLCPPPEVLNGQPAQVPVYLPHKNGRSLARLIHFFPLRNPNDKLMGVLGLITELPAPKSSVEPTAAQRVHAELAALRIALRHRFGLKTMVAQCLPMQRVLQQIHLVRNVNIPVLVTGEPGAGKQHTARTIHAEGVTASRAFVPIDCSSVEPEELDRTLTRLAESSDDQSVPAALRPGTVYLAHVERLARDIQTRILEWASRQSHKGDATRWIGASTSQLRLALDAGDVRSDFYHWIAPVTIELPALRHRLEDLPLLAQTFLEARNHSADKQIGGFSQGVLEQFRRYNWPGNLDELRAVVEECWTACDAAEIQLSDLPFRFRTGLEAQLVGPRKHRRPRPLEPLLAAVEKEQIELALQQARNNKSKAAELLDITRARLYRRMQALEIEDREP